MMYSVGNPGKSDERQFDLNRLTLRFRDSNVERLFQSETLRQSIHFIRAYFIAGTLLYIPFGILDVVVGGPSLFSILAIRYGGVAAVLVGLFALSLFPLFFRVAQAAPSADTLAFVL